jgi:transmembrane sensor
LASAGPIDAINDRAAEWAVETAHGALTPEARAALDDWLAADRRHRGAYVRACAWLHATEDAVVAAHADRGPRALVSGPPITHEDNRVDLPAAPGRLGPSRWPARLVGGGAALAASVAALIVAGVPILRPFGRPEPAVAANVMALADGSVATLGRNARIDVAMSGDIRRITLLSGEASFRVAPDKARPFVVRSGEIYAQATGTVYSVSRVDRTGGTVKVTEGSVLVWPRDDRDQAVLVRAGGTVTLDPGPGLPAPKRPEAARLRLPPPELAQISLDDVPVGSAVARFNRVNSTRIVVSDARIRAIRIIGLYRANDPERFAQAISTIAGATVRHDGNDIVIEPK